jgi:hypothetical protein
MTRLGEALKLTDAVRTKTFELGGHAFKVKVPLNAELEAANKQIYDVPEDVIKARLEKMTSTLRAEKIEGVEVTDDDVIVEGKSVKETVVGVLHMERRVVEYMKFLVPETGDLENITYEEIEAEFPLQVQFELLEAITNAIQPGYKDARKN